MRNADKQKGVAAVEFALLLTLLVPIAFGCTEFGRLFYQYNTLLKATRPAARAMSLAPGNVNQATALCLAVYGNPVCPVPDSAQDTPLVPGLTAANVFFITNDPASNGVSAGNVPVVRVEIRNFAFVSLVPWVVPSFTLGTLGTSMRQVAP